MGASLLIALAKRYLPFIIGGVLLGLVLWYIHHTIYQDGREDERAEWVKRDAETDRKSQELLKLKKHEADMINQQNRERARTTRTLTDGIHACGIPIPKIDLLPFCKRVRIIMI